MDKVTINGTVMEMELQDAEVVNYGTIMHLSGSNINVRNNGTIMNGGGRPVSFTVTATSPIHKKRPR